MKTYIFYYQRDSKCEPVGRVKATGLDEARKLIMQIKNLSEQSVNYLFVIKEA